LTCQKDGGAGDEEGGQPSIRFVSALDSPQAAIWDY